MREICEEPGRNLLLPLKIFEAFSIPNFLLISSLWGGEGWWDSLTSGFLLKMDIMLQSLLWNNEKILKNYVSMRNYSFHQTECFQSISQNLTQLPSFWHGKILMSKIWNYLFLLNNYGCFSFLLNCLAYYFLCIFVLNLITISFITF